jgi:UDPglucose--hexose-1-phosphate uridylyltransferase
MRSSPAKADPPVSSDGSSASNVAQITPWGTQLAAESPVAGQTGTAVAEVAEQQTHLRMDAISGRWTLFASNRNDRPNEFVTASSITPSADGCPFCEGQEDQTPSPVLVVASGEDTADTPQDLSPSGWGIRVVPNKFPAVDPVPAYATEATHYRPANGGEAARFQRQQTAESQESPLFRSRPTFGGHEVFIESPEHFSSLADLDLSHVITLLKVYQSRLQYWRSNPAIQYVSLFKNVGPAAGASLCHPHSQLVALSDLPPAVKMLADRMRVHHARTGCCLQCDILRAEMKANQRIVAVTDSLVAYCPYASHLPLLLRVTTRRHIDQFELLCEQEVDELARLIRRSIGWLRALHPDIAYNFLIHTRPSGVPDTESFHWSFELFPRLTQSAGFEWSCDCTINPTLPEVAAKQLRSVAMRENPLRT